MTLSVDDLIATAQPRTVKASVCARGDLVDRHAELVGKLAALVANTDTRSINGDADGTDEIHEQLLAVEAEQEEHTIEFTMQSIGPLAWSNLRRDHPPRPGLDSGMTVNMETFPPAAVAACAVPTITLDQAISMYGTDKTPGVLHSAEWDKLFNAACSANGAENPRPKLAAAIESLLQNGRSSTTAAHKA